MHTVDFGSDRHQTAGCPVERLLSASWCLVGSFFLLFQSAFLEVTKYYSSTIAILNNFSYKNQSFKASFAYQDFAPIINSRIHVQIWSNETVILSVYEVKWVIFKLIFCHLKMLARPWPLQCSIPRVRPFKWGTVWRFISSGMKTAST